MPVLANIGQLARCLPEGGQGAVQPVPDAALAFEADTVRWVGPHAELPAEYASWEQWDAGGGLVTPGLIDCHTHLAFGGFRADEFEQRVRGDSYLDIARAGGGIASTVRATRSATEQQLVDKALPMLREMACLGVTTLECKSGYGLSHEHELMLLRAYARLDDAQPLTLVRTYLGAHIVPPEHADRRDAYIDEIIDRTLPAIAEQRLAEFCDVFVEDGAYTVEEARRIFAAATGLGLGAKVHADQLSDSGGAALAAEVGAVSADHLEQASDAGLAAMAERGVVGVLLPLASLYTFQPPADGRRLIEAGVGVAVSTDFNPGSAPSYVLPFAMALACTLHRLTPAESLKAATTYAAQACGRQDTLGSLSPGMAADFALFDAPSVNHWLYQLRHNACRLTVKAGEVVFGDPLVLS